MNLDSDYIHNIKKLINSIHSSKRTLQMGPYQTASLAILRPILELPQHEHGAKLTDLNRKGYRAMDFPSAARLISPKFLNCLDQKIASEKQKQYIGIRSYLEMVHRYAEIFMSETCSLVNRIKNAAYVTIYLLILQGYAKYYVGYKNSNKPLSWYEDKSILYSYISKEAKLDTIMSCHFAVLIIVLFRDHWPTLSIPFKRLGSDCCEDLFSSLGSFVMNKWTYTLREGLDTIRTRTKVSAYAHEHGIFEPKRLRSGSRTLWKEDEKKSGNQTQYPDNDEIKAAWNAGVREAKRELKEVLEVIPAKGAQPVWFKKPESNLGIDTKKLKKEYKLGLSEEELCELNEDEKESVESVEDVESTEEGGGEDNSDEATHYIADSSSIIDSIDQILDHSEKASHKMEVPGVGVVHKQTICSWFSSGTENISCDRGIRAGQATSGETIGKRNFDIRSSEWTVQLGGDCAVLFDDKVFLGKITRMRRHYSNGSKADYLEPIDISLAKKHKELLWFQMCWYKRKGESSEYNYGEELDTEEVHITCVICPIVLNFNGEKNVHILPEDQQQVLDLALEGITELSSDEDDEIDSD